MGDTGQAGAGAWGWGVTFLGAAVPKGCIIKPRGLMEVWLGRGVCVRVCEVCRDNTLFGNS